MTHHWMPCADFGNDDAWEERSKNEYGCKHCEATGRECGQCFGDGIEPGTEDEPCGVCDGEGVLID